MAGSLIGLVLAGISVFLIGDSLLALFLGKKYVLWGLEHTPEAYGRLIRRLSGLPAPALFLIKAAEGWLAYACISFRRASEPVPRQ